MTSATSRGHELRPCLTGSGRSGHVIPTSIGYRPSFNGLTPLLPMLNGRVPGVVVLNIDNGFEDDHTAGLTNLEY